MPLCEAKGAAVARSACTTAATSSAGDSVAEVIAAMKAIGLDIGDYRLSLYSLFAALVVAVLLYVAVRVVLRASMASARRDCGCVMAT